MLSLFLTIADTRSTKDVSGNEMVGGNASGVFVRMLIVFSPLADCRFRTPVAMQYSLH